MAEPTATATPPPVGGRRPDAVSFLPKTHFVRLVAALPKLALRRCASCFLTAVSPPLSPESKNAVQPQTPLATHEGEAPEEPEAEQPQHGEHAADADADAVAAAPEGVGGKHQTRRHNELSLYDGGACMQATQDLEALAVAPKRPVASAEPEEPKKGKRQRAKKAKRTAAAAVPVAFSAKAIAGKYWRHRHSLFSLYDRGVRMDAEGWYSATPEAIAAAQAARAAPADLVVDAFAGVGGNSIQFAARGCYVVAVEIDPRKVELARHNAMIYGVEDKIEFVIGDFFQLAPYLKADLVFLSPPWGGPSYNKTPMYTLDKTPAKRWARHTLFEAAEKIAPSIIMFLPRNVNMGEVAELGCFSSPPLDFECEVNYLQGRIKGITAYFGNVAQPLVLKPRSGRKC